MKKENLRFYVLLGIIAIILVIVIVSSVISNVKGKKTVDQIKDLINKEGSHLVYFMSSNCSYCELYEYVVDEMKEYDVEFNKIDISKLTTAQTDEIVYLLKIGTLDANTLNSLTDMINETNLDENIKTKFIEYINQNTITSEQLDEINTKMSEVLNEEDFEIFIQVVEEIGNYGTPNLTVVGDGRVKSQLEGYNTTKDLFSYLKDNKFIKESDELNVNYVTKEQFDNILNDEDKQLVVFGKSTCIHCLDYHKTLNEYGQKTNNKVIYVTLDDLFTTEEEYNDIILEYPFISQIEATPTTVIIKDKEIIDSISGAISLSELETFISNN